jgi:glutaredoxin
MEEQYNESNSVEKEEKVKIIVAEGCGHCEEIKSMNMDHIEIIDVNDPKAEQYIDKTQDNITVPIAVDQQGKTCELYLEDGVLVVKCENKSIVATAEESTIVTEENLDDQITDET